MTRGRGNPAREFVEGTGASVQGVRPCREKGERAGASPGDRGRSFGAEPGPSHPPFAPAAVDPNKERREAVKRKITQYLRRAEEIFNCHLQRAAGGGNSIATVRGWRGAARVGWQRFCDTGERGWGCAHADKAAPAVLLVCLLPDNTLRCVEKTAGTSSCRGSWPASGCKGAGTSLPCLGQGAEVGPGCLGCFQDPALQSVYA